MTDSSISKEWSFDTDKRKLLYKTADNKANLIDKHSGPQYVFINTDSSGESKTEQLTLGKNFLLSSSITSKVPESH